MTLMEAREAWRLAREAVELAVEAEKPLRALLAPLEQAREDAARREVECRLAVLEAEGNGASPDAEWCRDLLGMGDSP